ncbi:MAG TPA: RHS repeat-associated core domain-containing protein, partial [Vicinamibacterales bacterium]|nr:RHS repeat-associated core domain-containing protein [Vicinamibacterales bacterium]
MRSLLVVIVCWGSAAAVSGQVDAKFRPADDAAVTRYEVQLALDPGDDAASSARQLAATYGVQLETDAASDVVVVTSTESRARLLSGDRRVAFVQPSSNAAVRPVHVTANATGFGAYNYDASGNITQAGDDTFVYDRIGRIHKATINGIEQTFTYDSQGNITKIATLNGDTRDIAVGEGNKLSGAAYDDSGNLLSYHGGTFVYDGLNVVKESRPTGGNRHLYLYTASNERLATIELLGGGLQESEWTIRDDGGRVLRRLVKHGNGQWSWKEDYIYRGGELLAAEVPGPEKVRHFHLDHLGTPRLITGNGGAKLADRAYSAFGRGLTTAASNTHEQLEFTGHERDSYQLDYMHARYYDPMLGRFLSVDPGKDWDLRQPQSWNMYSYVRNNPINRIDPTGRCGEDASFIGPRVPCAAQSEAKPKPQRNNSPAQGQEPGTQEIPDGKGGKTIRTYGPDG